jgi:5-methylcytosine-specific restriction endonuclease McrA
MIEHVVEGCQCEGKLCPACTQIKCIGAFGKKLDKLRSRCKVCHALYQKEWSEAHPGYNSTQCAQYYQENKEELLAKKRSAYQLSDIAFKKQEQERVKAYYRANPEKQSEHHTKYYQANRTEIIARTTAHQKAYPERQRIQRRAHYQAHQQHHRSCQSAYYYANHARTLELSRTRRQRRRTRRAQAGGHYTHQEWEALKFSYGYLCLRCGRQEPEIKLTPDHIIPLAKGGSNNIENIQPLCRSCNCSKGVRIIDYRRREREQC